MGRVVTRRLLFRSGRGFEAGWFLGQRRDGAAARFAGCPGSLRGLVSEGMPQIPVLGPRRAP